MPELDLYLQRIREIRPELTIERASLNREGLLNDIGGASDMKYNH